VSILKKNKFVVVIIMLIVLTINFTNILGYGSSGSGSGSFGGGFDSSAIPSDEGRVTELDAPISKIWGNVSLTLKLLSVAGIIIMGIRYMFSTFEIRSKIKEGMPTLIIGIVIVFAATYVIDFIVDVTVQTLSN
jgi:type IV secretory pathway VirB2 component (pilin)